MQDCVLRRDLESLAQNALAFRIASARAVEISEIHISGNKKTIETDRGADFLFRLRRIAAICVERSEVDARLGAIGIVSLARNVFLARALENAALLGAQLVRRHGREHAHRLDAQRFQWIGEERRGQWQAHGERCVGKRLERGEPEQGIGVAQALGKCFESALAI